MKKDNVLRLKNLEFQNEHLGERLNDHAKGQTILWKYLLERQHYVDTELMKLKESNKPQDNNNDSNNNEDSESGFKHMNTIPNTGEELTFTPRKIGASKVDAWNGNQVALETPKGRGNADTNYSLYTEQEARDLANALYSASNYLRSQK